MERSCQGGLPVAYELRVNRGYVYVDFAFWIYA